MAGWLGGWVAFVGVGVVVGVGFVILFVIIVGRFFVFFRWLLFFIGGLSFFAPQGFVDSLWRFPEFLT